MEHNVDEQDVLQKLDKLGELYWQQWQSGNQHGLTELETSEELFSLSKEVASYYKPLVEKLVEAGILMVNTVAECAVFEVASVMPEEKSYFNEGKILLFAEEQINGEDGKLKAEYKKRLGKFVS